LLPTNGLVAWDWYDRKGFNLDKKVEFELNGFSDKLFIVSPIKDNWAIIGRSDKYLSCAANKEVETSGSRLTVTLHESGPVVIWSGKGIPHSKQFPIVDLGNGFYEVKMVVGEKNRKLILER
jgi:hypothetical protein